MKRIMKRVFAVATTAAVLGLWAGPAAAAGWWSFLFSALGTRIG